MSYAIVIRSFPRTILPLIQMQRGKKGEVFPL